MGRYVIGIHIQDLRDPIHYPIKNHILRFLNHIFCASP
jgi:hypothetical protein